MRRGTLFIREGKGKREAAVMTEKSSQLPGDTIKASLESWLHATRAEVEEVRERYGPDQVAEVLAEAQFYEDLLKVLDTGAYPSTIRARPPQIVIETTLQALDHSALRAREWSESTRRRGDLAELAFAESTERVAMLLRGYAERVASISATDPGGGLGDNSDKDVS